MFRITYDDNSVFDGRSIPESDWNKQQDKPIKFFDYRHGVKLYTFVGFNEYNHLVERIGFKTSKITKVMLIGRSEKESCIITIADKVYFNTSVIGDEYSTKILAGWKLGVVSREPYIIEKDLRNNVIRSIY